MYGLLVKIVVTLLILLGIGHLTSERTFASLPNVNYATCGYVCDPSLAAEQNESDRAAYEAALGIEQEIQASVANAPQPLIYQVNSGDTLYQIARTFNVSVSELSSVNSIQNPNSLKVGQPLQIPGKVIDAELSNGNAVVSKVLMSTLTAYTAGVESTGKRPSDPAYGMTYSGSNALEGRTIAVDPGVIPIGATVFIDGIGVRTAEDTGSAIRGARIDVFMNDLGQARQFGVKKNVLVYVLS
jgi:3D (Asp-Asp-Asp) domain-containing protein